MTEFDALIADITKKIKAADRKPVDALRVQLQGVLPAPMLAQAMDALAYYIESCPATLRDFAVAVSAGYSASLQQVAMALYQYLTEPNDFLLDDRNGVLGFLDDAWLIHNTAYRCLQSRLLDPTQFSADWNRIVVADAIALQLFPPQVKAALDGLVGQYSNLVAQEMRQFQPASSQVAASDSGDGKTIDDYYYTIGGKAYLSTTPIR
jgi:hypothetical protein